MAQYARPTSDVNQGSWTDEGSVDNDGSLCTSVDEVTQDGDDSYILAAAVDTTCELGLSSVDDPQVNTGHILRAWFRSIGGGAPERLILHLYEGATLRASSGNFTNRSGSYGEAAYTLTAEEADAISAYTDLRVKVESSNLATGDDMLVTQVEFEVPDAPSGYTLQCDGGSMGLIGTAAGTRADRKLVVDLGSLGFNGQIAGTLKDSKIIAEMDSFGLTGQIVGALKESKVILDSGSYNLTGQIVNLFFDRTIIPSLGDFDLTGQDVTLTKSSGYTIVAGTGSYTLVGQTAGLRQDKKISIEATGFNLVGSVAGLSYGRVIQVENGPFVLIGQDAGLLKGNVLLVEAGSYSIAGQDVTLLKSLIFPCEAANYSIVGQDVTLTKQTNYILSAASGSFSLGGDHTKFVQTTPVIITGVNPISGDFCVIQGVRHKICGNN